MLDCRLVGFFEAADRCGIPFHVETQLLSAQSPADLDAAAELLGRGGLVAFPTETVYGLGALALEPLAVRAIYAAKGRAATNPLIVHVLGEDDARPLCAPDGESARSVAEAMAPELEWDASRVEEELRDWRELARAEGIAVGEPAPAS